MLSLSKPARQASQQQGVGRKIAAAASRVDIALLPQNRGMRGSAFSVIRPSRTRSVRIQSCGGRYLVEATECDVETSKH